MTGFAVLGDVRQQFGGAEVGDGFDRGRWALGYADFQVDGHVAGRSEGSQGGAEALVEDRGMDSAGQVA